MIITETGFSGTLISITTVGLPISVSLFIFTGMLLFLRFSVFANI